MDKIQQRFEELAVMADAVAATKSCEKARKATKSVTTWKIDNMLMTQWQTSVLSLLDRVFGEKSSTFLEFKNEVEQRQHYLHPHFDKLHAIFLSAKSDYDGGFLFEVRNLVHAEIYSDELEQAEHFLKAGYKVPSAVIAGVVLETTLRKLCEQHDDGKPADKLNKMNDDLAKAGVYNKMRADQVRAWAKIRNDAAHGHPEEFDEGDVARMIDGVRDFVANQLS